MGRYLANVILVLVVVMAFCAVAMADYFLRGEATGKTRRALAADGVELNWSSVMRAVAGNEVAVLKSLAQVGAKLDSDSGSDLGWDWGALGLVPGDVLDGGKVDGRSGSMGKDLWSGQMTLLMVAVVAGADESVDFLLAQEEVRGSVRGSVNLRRAGDDLSVLDLALRVGDFDSARKLLAAGAGNLDGGSYLVRAVKGNDVALFDFLLEMRKMGKAGGGDGGEVVGAGKVLRWAVGENDLEWVRRLASVAGVLDLDLKAVGEVLGEDGENLLTRGYKAGADEMLALLLDLGVGAGLETRNVAGESLLGLALDSALDGEGAKDTVTEKKRGRDWLVLWLRAGASLEAVGGAGKDGGSGVDRLIDAGDGELLALVVKSMGVVVAENWMLKAFDLALVSASASADGEKVVGDGDGDGDERKGLRVLRLLLDLGGDVEAGRGDEAAGGRLLRRAVVAGDGDLVRWLLEADADPAGELWRVLATGDAGMLEVLLLHGANANEPLAIGVGSPLSLCLRKRRYDLARLLLEHGAEVGAAGGEGMSLLQQVVGRGDIRAANLLREFEGK